MVLKPPPHLRNLSRRRRTMDIILAAVVRDNQTRFPIQMLIRIKSKKHILWNNLISDIIELLLILLQDKKMILERTSLEVEVMIEEREELEEMLLRVHPGLRVTEALSHLDSIKEEKMRSKIKLLFT
jgi:hypothetical protein